LAHSLDEPAGQGGAGGSIRSDENEFVAGESGHNRDNGPDRAHPFGYLPQSVVPGVEAVLAVHETEPVDTDRHDTDGRFRAELTYCSVESGSGE
jgi:hypothetical protein